MNNRWINKTQLEAERIMLDLKKYDLQGSFNAGDLDLNLIVKLIKGSYIEITNQQVKIEALEELIKKQIIEIKEIIDERDKYKKDFDDKNDVEYSG